MRNRMCAWKQRDNRIHCNSILTCESGFARYSVLLNMPVSPVHLRESPLEKGRPTTRLALTARGGVRLWGHVNPQPGQCVSSEAHENVKPLRSSFMSHSPIPEDTLDPPHGLTKLVAC